MGKILIASGSMEKGKEIAALVTDHGLGTAELTISGSEVRRRTGAYEYDLVIIRSPLSDEFGRDFAVKLSERSYSEIIFICQNTISEELSELLGEHGITVLPKHSSPTDLLSAIRQSLRSRSIALSFRDNEKKVKAKSEEIRLVNMAKMTLTERKQFTEPEAHRYIEKQAMNTRRTRKEVAKKILIEYGE